MKKEAERMFPGVVVNNTVQAPVAAPAKKRGRPAKVTAHAVQ
jgi:hypothetical protein